MASINNEITRVNELTESKNAAVRALEKCKKREKKLLRKGWRWVKIRKNLSLFVPCDKHGKPTEEGEEKIRRYVECTGI